MLNNDRTAIIEEKKRALETFSASLYITGVMEFGFKSLLNSFL